MSNEKSETFEYDEEKTILQLDGDNCWIDLWIDGYYKDLEEPDDEEPWNLEEYYPEDVVRNALHCGRNLSAKEGFGAAWMFECEFILAGEVAGLRERFEALRDGRSDGFGPYPEQAIGGEGPPFMQFSAKRSERGIQIHLALFVGNWREEYDIPMDMGELEKTCAYFKRINEWFPPVGPGEKQRSRWAKKKTD